MKHTLLASVVASLVLAAPGTAQDPAGNKKVEKATTEKPTKPQTFELDKRVKKKKVATIDLNTADAKTIAKTLGIDDSAAQRVVERRTKIGPIESTDDLLVIPGVSRAAVTANFNKLGLPQGKLKLKVGVEAKPAKADGAPSDEAEKKTGEPAKKTGAKKESGAPVKR